MPSRPFAALLFCLLTTASAYGCMCGTVTEDADRIAAAAGGYDVVFIGKAAAPTVGNFWQEPNIFPMSSQFREA